MDIEPISMTLTQDAVHTSVDWGAMTAGFWAGFGIGCVVFYVINAWLLGRVFKKAGVARWKAWIPFVNIWNMLKIGGRSGANIFWAICGYLALGISTGCLGAFTADDKLVALPVVSIILSVAAVVFLVIYICKLISAVWNIQKKLNKPGPFILLYFVNLIAPLWLWILALDRSKWVDSKGRKQIK